MGNDGSEASYFPSFQLLHSVIDGYNSVTSTCLSLVGTSGRTLLSWRASWTTTGPSNTISSLVFHTTFAILRLVFLWLVISVLLRNYQRARAELYRPAVDLQDYEMVELFLRRLKMWMGLSRAKEVHFLFLYHLVQQGFLSRCLPGGIEILAGMSCALGLDTPESKLEKLKFLVINVLFFSPLSP